MVLLFLASNDNKENKGLSDEGEHEMYGRLPTESQAPSQGYSEISSQGTKMSSLEEEVNPLYINETERETTTKRPTKTKEKPATTTGKLISTKERGPTTTPSKVVSSDLFVFLTFWLNLNSD